MSNCQDLLLLLLLLFSLFFLQRCKRLFDVSTFVYVIKYHFFSKILKKYVRKYHFSQQKKSNKISYVKSNLQTFHE